MFSTIDTTGVLRYLGYNDMITMIDGEAYKLYVVSLKPFAHSRRNPRLKQNIVATINPFAYVAEDGKVVYSTPYQVKCDIHWEVTKKFDVAQGKEVPISIGHLNVLQARDDVRLRKAIHILFHDQAKGLAFSDQFAIVFWSVTYPNADWRGFVGAPVELDTPLQVESVEMQDGFETEDQVLLRTGTAMIRITRDQISREVIESSRDNYFTISLNGAEPVRYTLWNTDKGVCVEQSHHLNIYLQRAL